MEGGEAVGAGEGGGWCEGEGERLRLLHGPRASTKRHTTLEFQQSSGAV